MERTICKISFSRCSTIIELSPTKVCSCDDAKSYKHARVKLKKETDIHHSPIAQYETVLMVSHRNQNSK